MKKSIKTLLLSGLCTAAMLVLTFSISRVYAGLQENRSKEDVILLYEKEPEKDYSQHREEDFDPAGKRVIWGYIYEVTTGEYDERTGNLTLSGDLVWMLRQPWNENAWFAVSIWAGDGKAVDEWAQRIRAKGGYVSVSEDGKLVGFMTGGQILSLKEEDAPFTIGQQRRLIEQYAAELRDERDPLFVAHTIPQSSVSWRVEAFPWTSVWGAEEYTGPICYITSPEELETAIRYGPLKEQEAETWRQNYGSYFFEKRDLIVFQIGYGQQWDMVLLRAETAGDELRVILQKKSERSFGIMREILFVELPKDTLEGISSFSLRITGMN